MMLFGLACEGVTDHITLENILCGYFNNPDLDESITQLQPAFDETDQKQGGGGWPMLLKYLSSPRFREDVLNTEFIVLQIDTDIAEKLGVDHKDNRGNELPIETLIVLVRAKLIDSINTEVSEFYETHAPKIIFAICVHSIECWLVSYHAEQTAIHNCFDVLKAVPNIIRVAKKQRNYDKLSEPFLDRINIDSVARKDPSFRVFIQALAAIEEQVYRLNDVD